MTDNGRLPQRAAHDLYETPRANVEIAFDFLWRKERWLDARQPRWRVLDLGAGSGVWGEVARERWPEAFIHGVEIRPVPRPDAYNLWSLVDMRSWDTSYASEPFDLAIGNPPYSLDEEAVRIGLRKVRPNGIVVMLLPITFLTSQRRRDGLYEEHPLLYYAQFSQRISWNGSGKTPPRDHALYVWRKGWAGDCYKGYFLPNVPPEARNPA